MPWNDRFPVIVAGLTRQLNPCSSWIGLSAYSCCGDCGVLWIESLLCNVEIFVYHVLWTTNHFYEFHFNQIHKWGALDRPSAWDSSFSIDLQMKRARCIRIVGDGVDDHHRIWPNWGQIITDGVDSSNVKLWYRIKRAILTAEDGITVKNH
jgi:hypothetical protein